MINSPLEDMMLVDLEIELQDEAFDINMDDYDQILGV